MVAKGNRQKKAIQKVEKKAKAINGLTLTKIINKMWLSFARTKYLN